MAEEGSRKILVVDDEPLMVRTLEFGLRREGYDVCTARSGPEALAQFHRHQPDVVLLDARLPDLDGWETCRRLRTLSDVPIIMVTAAAGEQQAVDGFKSGADGYVTKPFSMPVMLAQNGRVLAAANRRPPPNRLVYDGGRLIIDLDRKQVDVDGRPASLSALEFKLLEYLAANRPRVLSQDQILDHVWGEDYVGTPNLVKVYVSTLRKAVEANPQQPRYIITHRGFGYSFCDDRPAGSTAARG